MGVVVNELYSWIKEYAERINSAVCVYGAKEIYDGELTDDTDLLEIKRKNNTDIILRWYKTNQNEISSCYKSPISVLGISFLGNQQMPLKDDREYIINSDGVFDCFNKAESLSFEIKKEIDAKETLKDKLFCLFDHHD